MKLFIIVYIFGQAAASVGPLPYGMEHCQKVALPQLHQMQVEGWAAHVKSGQAAKLKPWKDGRIFHGPADTINRCEWHERSPVKNIEEIKAQ